MQHISTNTGRINLVFEAMSILIRLEDRMDASVSIFAQHKVWCYFVARPEVGVLFGLVIITNTFICSLIFIMPIMFSLLLTIMGISLGFLPLQSALLDFAIFRPTSGLPLKFWSRFNH